MMIILMVVVGVKVNSTSRDDDYDHDVGGEMDMLLNNDSNFSYGNAEALTAEIDEVNELVEEVLRIKELILNSKGETIEIGKAVNGIRRHSSKEIRHIAQSLIEYDTFTLSDNIDYTCLCMECYCRQVGECYPRACRYHSAHFQGGTPDLVNPSIIDEEEGIPSPTDEGALFSIQPIDFS
ncbi:putative mediator of RNA polymerase II transcription subunit 26b [Bienertia sinuspersici]